MTKELFEKAKFGDRFVTRGGQEALFLRLTENAEWRLADFYVKDWGLIRVNRENGKCLNGPDIENDIVGMNPSLPSNLDEAAEDFAEEEWDGLHDNNGNPLFTQDYIEYTFKAGAEWMAGKGVSFDTEMSWLDSFGFQIGWPEDTSIFDCFNEGDKVVVQIRKK